MWEAGLDGGTGMAFGHDGFLYSASRDANYIALLRPNGGDSWTIGQYQNIHWSRQNPSGNTVDIDYSTDNGITWRRMATQAADTGWYLWNVPGPVTTTAKVRIRDHETPSMTDMSGAVFTIVSP